MRRRSSSVHRDAACADDRGSIAVIVVAAFIPLTMVFAVVADGGRVWMEKQVLQDRVEASALATAQSWSRDRVECPRNATDMASTDPNASVLCSVDSVASGDVATVSVRGSVALQFARVLGRASAQISSSASVRIGSAAEMTGLRPIAMCATNPALTSWLGSGKLSTSTYTIPIESSTPSCGSDVSGNWGVIDFDGGSNSISDAQGWIENGYDGAVSVGSSMAGDPGIPSPALTLDTLVGRSVTLPVFENPRLVGSRAMYDVVGFVRVRLVSVRLSGSTTNRHVQVVFERGLASGGPTSPGSPNFGVSAWAVCSLDGKGTCS